MKTWYRGQEGSQPEISRSIREAFNTQSQIGWKWILYGWLAKDWRKAQDRWLDRISTKWKPSSLKWSTQVAKWFIEFHHSLWEHRNTIYHDPQHPWRLQAKQEKINTMKQRYVQLASLTLPPSDRWLLSKSISDLEVMDIDSIIQWNSSAEQVLKDLEQPRDRALRQTTVSGWLRAPG